MRKLAIGAIIGLVIGTLLNAALHIDAQELRQEYLRVTFYTLTGRMADGAFVHRDAAACSNWIPLGSQLQLPDGYVVMCEDRGNGDWFWRGWLDVWAPSYRWGLENVERAYGPYVWTTVLRWGWEDQ